MPQRTRPTTPEPTAHGPGEPSHAAIIEAIRTEMRGVHARMDRHEARVDGKLDDLISRVGGLEAGVSGVSGGTETGPWWRRHATSGALVMLGIAAGVGIGVLVVMGVVDQGMLLKIIDATAG